jgi:hypothetical protein
VAPPPQPEGVLCRKVLVSSNAKQRRTHPSFLTDGGGSEAATGKRFRP